jgi:preprotein translocase subunit YajC
MPGSDTTDLLITLDQAAPAGAGFDWMGLVLMVVAMGAIMYFLVYRPQQKERAAREALLTSITKGDEVITNGGIHGTVVSVDDNLVKVEIASKTTVTVDKDAIQRRAGDPPPAPKK